MSFDASDSIDVTNYRLYISEAPYPVTHSSPSVNIGNKTSIDLSIVEMLAGKQAVYNLGVSAIDDFGNSSELSVMNNVFLDFKPPNPPGSLIIAI